MDYAPMARALDSLRREARVTQEDLHAEYRTLGGKASLRSFRAYLRGEVEPKVTTFVLMAKALDEIGDLACGTLEQIERALSQ